MFTLTPGVVTRSELVEKRSRFITTLARTDSEDEARGLISEVRSEFPDARHNCSAFIVAGTSGPAGPPRLHSSDDGEPSGTAGPPMLEVLRGADLMGVCAVVTRYFGGTLLGTGGLVRAYSAATAQAIAAAPLLRIVQLEGIEVQVPAEHAGRVEAEARRRGWHIQGQHWGRDLSLELAVLPEVVAETEAAIAATTRGSAALRSLGPVTVEVPA